MKEWSMMTITVMSSIGMAMSIVSVMGNWMMGIAGMGWESKDGVLYLSLFQDILILIDSCLNYKTYLCNCDRGYFMVSQISVTMSIVCVKTVVTSVMKGSVGMMSMSIVSMTMSVSCMMSHRMMGIAVMSNWSQMLRHCCIMRQNWDVMFSMMTFSMVSFMMKRGMMAENGSSIMSSVMRCISKVSMTVSVLGRYN
jgi:hypothetical protein